MSDALPPPLEPLAFLAGTWTGTGELHYPTIETAHYTETISFSCDGRPFFAYEQRTRLIEADRPAHAEAGFWRHVGDGRVEVMLSHVTGLVEILEGTVHTSDGVTVVELASTLVAGSSTAVPVEATTRRFEGDGTTMRYDMSMAAAGQPMTHHLAATFTRAVA
ncbi:MAG: FABP family protein [Acidimicrobiales bacterium]